MVSWCHGEVARPLVDCCVIYGFKRRGNDSQSTTISASGGPPPDEDTVAQGTPMSLIQRTLKNFGVSHDLEAVDTKATVRNHVMVDVRDIECLDFFTRPTFSIETLSLGNVDIDDNIDPSLLDRIDLTGVKHIAMFECANVDTLRAYFILVAADVQVRSVSLDNFANYIDLGHDEPEGAKAFLKCFSGLERLHIATGENDWSIDFSDLKHYANTLRDLVWVAGSKGMFLGPLAEIATLFPNLQRFGFFCPSNQQALSPSPFRRHSPRGLGGTRSKPQEKYRGI
jgi:hypothetical protein